MPECSATIPSRPQMVDDFDLDGFIDHDFTLGQVRAL
jgi:hypothetical protein